MRDRAAACESVFVVAFNRSANRTAIIVACRGCAGGCGLQRIGADGFRRIIVLAGRINHGVLVTLQMANGALFVLAPRLCAGRIIIRHPRPAMFDRVAVRECVTVVLLDCSADRTAIIIACRCRTGGRRLQRIGADGFRGVAVLAGRIDRGVLVALHMANGTFLMLAARLCAGRIIVRHPRPAMCDRIATLERVTVVLLDCSADRAAIIVACRVCAGGCGLQRIGADGFRSIAVFAGWVDCGVLVSLQVANRAFLVLEARMNTSCIRIRNPLPVVIAKIANGKGAIGVVFARAANGATVIIARRRDAGCRRTQRSVVGFCQSKGMFRTQCPARGTDRTNFSGCVLKRFPGRMFAKNE